MRRLSLSLAVLTVLSLAVGCCGPKHGACGTCNSCGVGGYGGYGGGGYAPTYGTPYGAVPGAYYVPGTNATAVVPSPYGSYPTTATVPTESLATY